MRKRRVVTGLVVGAFVVVLAWMSGWPQGFVLGRVVSGTLGAYASGTGVAVFPEIEIEHLSIYPDTDSRESGGAFASLEGVRVEYTLFSEDGRNVSLMHIDTLRLYPDASDPENSNFQFLIDYLGDTPPETSVRWVPERIVIGAIEVEGAWEELEGVIGGLTLSLDIRDEADVDLRLEGVGLSGGIGGRYADFDLEWLALDGGTCLVEVGIRGVETRLTWAHEVADGHRVEGKAIVMNESGAESTGEMRVRVIEGLELDTKWVLQELENSLSVGFVSREKSTLLRVLPEAFGAGLEELPFDGLNGRGEVKWDAATFSVESAVQSVSRDGADPIDVDIGLSGEFGRIAETVGKIDAHVGKGFIRAKGARDSNDVYSARIELDHVQLKPLVFLATGNRLPETISGVIDGGLVVESYGDSEGIRFAPSFVLSEVMYGETVIDTVHVDGELSADTESGDGEIRNVVIATEDETLRFEMKEAFVNLDSGDLDGEIGYAVDLELVMGLLELEGFYGGAAGSVTLGIVDGQYSMPFTFRSEDAGYNDIALPYGTVIDGEGTFSLNEDSSEWAGEEIVARIGEGTVVHVGHVTGTEAGVKAEMDFQSDLKVGMGMGYFSNVEGAFEGEAAWELPRDGEMRVEWEISGTMENLLLNDNAGTVSGFVVSAEGDYAEEFHGGGQFTASNVTVSGAEIDSLSGPIGFVDNVMVVTDAEARVFDGTLVSQVEMRVLEEGFPLKYTGRLENIDLVRLTEEVEPPKTTLTGIAEGTITAEYSLAGGLKDFDLDAASDTDFTINRSLVEEMMQMQNVLAGLAEKKAEKTVAKFLGEADQRPFETARMNVYLVEDVIEGVVEMRSQKTKDYNGLNLTIQLNIDKEALVASLKLLEESNVENVKF